MSIRVTDGNMVVVENAGRVSLYLGNALAPGVVTIAIAQLGMEAVVILTRDELQQALDLLDQQPTTDPSA